MTQNSLDRLEYGDEDWVIGRYSATEIFLIIFVVSTLPVEITQVNVLVKSMKHFLFNNSPRIPAISLVTYSRDPASDLTNQISDLTNQISELTN